MLSSSSLVKEDEKGSTNEIENENKITDFNEIMGSIPLTK